tara:strand:+ start:307 stop:600 length:294 start_codon:yes stop_codon:yes gene_type:complete
MKKIAADRNYKLVKKADPATMRGRNPVEASVNPRNPETVVTFLQYKIAELEGVAMECKDDLKTLKTKVKNARDTNKRKDYDLLMETSERVANKWLER